MDSINGPSEENQPKKEEDKIRFVQTGDMIRTRLDELPSEERERILAYMEMMDSDEEPEMYLVDFKMEFDDASDIPMDFLASMYRDAVFNEEYEEVDELAEEIKKRNYNIEITEKSVTLTRNETDKN
jgi:hypothetical protein